MICSQTRFALSLQAIGYIILINTYEAAIVAYCLFQLWYRAMYDFTARTDVEISLQKGQMVRVKTMHDLDGNSEWWLVDINGKEGYAPANYLSAT